VPSSEQTAAEPDGGNDFKQKETCPLMAWEVQAMGADQTFGSQMWLIFFGSILGEIRDPSGFQALPFCHTLRIT
jgi:hypothetical protein